MYIAQNNTLTIVRGDTAEISIQLVDEEAGTPYMLGSAEYVEFDIFSVRGAEPIVARRHTGAQDSDGTVTVMLRSIDTLLFNGTYKYMVRLINSDSGSVDTILGLEPDAYIIIK